jgi:hypothetical protein
MEQYDTNSLTWQVKSSFGSTSYTASGLMPSMSYEFRVRARNSIDWGTKSLVFTTATSSSVTVPDAPTL